MRVSVWVGAGGAKSVLIASAWIVHADFPCPHAPAAEGGPPDLLPTVGSIERLDPRFDALVPQGAVIENECAMHSSGAIYVTDPPYGLPKGFDDPARELDFCGVYRIAPDGTHLGTLLTGQATANCGFSDDGQTLFMTAVDPLPKS